MRIKILVVVICFFSSTAIAQRDIRPANRISLKGHIGERLDACIAHNVIDQDVDHLIAPFKQKTETERWQSEFLGKWMLGACKAYQYKKDAGLLKKISYAAQELMKTQLPNGYIGNYSEAAQLAQWDVWGRKYSLLALQAYYEISGDPKVIPACKKLADHLLKQVGPGAADIIHIGNYKGMAAGSILEPIMFLYKHTGEARYLDFAKYIVGRWETTEGPQLIGHAISGIPVAKRFWPFPKAKEWALGGHKSYEMMSCYVGLLELYKVTGNATYLSAVEMTAEDIMRNEMNIAGGASSTECWFDGARHQATPAFLSMETCVTFTWMQLCERLLDITGKVKYADQIENTAYNALQAAAKQHTMMFASYVPLEGFRRDGERQCGMDINCCKANGPRAFTLLPGFAFHAAANRLTVNLYTESEAQLVVGSNIVSLAMQTGYPVTENISLTVNPEKESEFELALRIPAWSKKNSVSINGEPVQATLLPGAYLVLNRKWKKGDRVVLNLDLRGRMVMLGHHMALLRGPVVLARDSRFKDGFVDETIAIEHDKDYYVPLIAMPEKPGFAWMAFTVNALTSIYNGDKESFRKVHFTDFGSAGNSWDEHERYKIWLTKTIETADRETWW